MAAQRLGDEVIDIMNCIRKGKCFLLSGGAGSGKTYSLVQVLKQLSLDYPTARFACITYTNSAAVEIRNRAKIKNLIVSTIHDFLWDTISPFQNEMKQTLIELINDPESSIKNPVSNEVYTNEFTDGIQYKEYVRLADGCISHDEVIALANRMYSKYTMLCDFLIDSFQFIFVDEYQDTSPLVIEILLDYISKRKKKNLLGFFGDSMQSIYEDGVGDIESYVTNKDVIKIEKEQNRRNPSKIICIANRIRTDGLVQKPSDDISAPNMTDGVVNIGSAKFLYSKELDLKRVKASPWCKSWDFADSEKTKELRLTHNLIAVEAGFTKLMEIYDADPIVKFKRDFKLESEKQGFEINPDDTFEAVVNSMDWPYKSGERKGRQRRDVLLEDELSKRLFEHVGNWPYQKVQRIYLDKDNLIDDKIVVDGITIREPKRDRLIQHLFKIQEIISLYKNNRYNELIQKISFQIMKNADRRTLKDAIEKIDGLVNDTTSIGDVIDYADSAGLCKIDDRLLGFIEENEYLYWRAKDVPFSEFQRLYLYLEGYTPFSTQHKTKGREFDNVLVILHNGEWSNYNFEYLFDGSIFSLLSSARKNSYPSILTRTKKLFYVCCTRAKNNLIVFYPDPTQNVLSGAEALFGKENCISLD